MNPVQVILLVLALLVAGSGAVASCAVRRRNLHVWLAPYIVQRARRGRLPRDIDVLLCIADHFEPHWNGHGQGRADADTADARVASWVRDYPRLLGHFRDSDGRPPRHTYFYPIDQYEPTHVDALAALCRDGYGELELHLHHDRDTAENLERSLRRFTALFSERHGILGAWPDGSPAYGFVHGNWALDNSRTDGRWCGVCNELDVLSRTGCYADFTLPSAPDATQTRVINQIYYASGTPGRCKSHDRGVAIGRAPQPPGSLMLIQGPLLLARSNGRLLPRIENGCLQRSQPPTAARLNGWLRTHIHVPRRPDWFFVKLHTHGAKEANRPAILGGAAAEFHRELAARAATDRRFRFHYVSAREMYNLARAADAGWTGSVAQALDWVVRAPGPDNARRAPDPTPRPAVTARSAR